MHLAVLCARVCVWGMRCECVCVCISSTAPEGKTIWKQRKRGKDDTKVQSDWFTYTVKMKIAGEGIPSPSKAEMMTAKHGTCVMPLCTFFKRNMHVQFPIGLKQSLNLLLETSLCGLKEK